MRCKYQRQYSLPMRILVGVHLGRLEAIDAQDSRLPIPQKVALDAEYLRRQSLWFDLRILWMTFVKVLRRDGVAH